MKIAALIKFSYKCMRDIGLNRRGYYDYSGVTMLSPSQRGSAYEYHPFK
jgi:hypothetical protein